MLRGSWCDSFRWSGKDRETFLGPSEGSADGARECPSVIGGVAAQLYRASFGGHGYGHIFRNVVPMMGKRGYNADEIDAILVRNPRRLLTFV